MNRIRKKGFTLLESLFSLIILSVISMVFIFGIFQMTKNKDNNLKIVKEINDVENIFEQIKYNISKKVEPLDNVVSDFKIEVLDEGEFFYIVLKTREKNGETYEVYFNK